MDFSRILLHMEAMRLILPMMFLALAGCGEAVDNNHFAEDVREARPVSAAPETQAVPVRVGELGPNFPACAATGVTRNLAAGRGLSVRAAPFDTAAELGQLPAGSRFFVCTRSHDQKWFGIVYASEGGADGCGVSEPLPSRRAYDGPCRSGWVSSPFVRLTARLEQAAAPR